MLSLPPLSLYIHIPWCIRKCPYCDFNSHTANKGGDLPIEAYLSALEEDLQDSARYAQARKLQSIFFGGGTPSLMPADAIARCIQTAKDIIGLESDAEVTLEANPGTFEQQRFFDFREAGVNRLSIGVQSLNDPHLKALGRIHSSGEAVIAIKSARDAGFENINLDMMYGLPEQSKSEALEDLSKLIELKPEHISWYELTIEPNTEFYRRPPSQPDDDYLFDISESGIELLESHGYYRYEVSAYSQKNRQSLHNLNYWQFGDYLGVGAGAHEKVTLAEENRIVRRSKTRMPQHFIDRIGSRLASETDVAPEDRIFEFCINALRLTNGVDTRLISERIGINESAMKSQLIEHIDNDLVQFSKKNIKPTSLGLRHLNTLLQALIS